MGRFRISAVFFLGIIVNLRKILILGVGNILMGDEGVGIHAIRSLEREIFPPHVTLLDGGTGGFQLLSYFEEFPTIVMIDATMDGKPPGSVSVIEPRFASDFPRALSAHDIGLRDLIESASLLGPLPKTYLITVSIAAFQGLQMELSAEIEQSLPLVSGHVHEVLNLLAEQEGATTAPRAAKE